MTISNNSRQRASSGKRPMLLSLAVTSVLLSGVVGLEQTANDARNVLSRRQLRRRRAKEGRQMKKDHHHHAAANEETRTNPEKKDQQLVTEESEQRPLLDFAVVGFPKTGTSFMEHYLFNTEETNIDNQEHCLTKQDPTATLEKLVDNRGYEINKFTKDGVRVKNAIKCPHEILGPFSLKNYEELFPDMKFVVSTRHPVLWFQSWYNYKLRQRYKHSKGKTIWAPPTNHLIGPCLDDTAYHYGYDRDESGILSDEEKGNVCTDGAKFHHALSRFGKTPIETDDERTLLGHDMSIHSLPKAKIFLMEVGQFNSEDQEHAQLLLDDLKEFLGLEEDLPPLLPHTSKELVEEVQEHAIDICEPEHDLVRAELVQTGVEAYVWIRDYFLQSPDVVVSGRDHFLDLIEKWQYDPCENDTQDRRQEREK